MSLPVRPQPVRAQSGSGERAGRASRSLRGPRLVDDAASTKTLRFDRRYEPRTLVRHAEDRSNELAVSYSSAGERFGITVLEVVDTSERGLGARSRVPIEAGMTVTICPAGSGVPWRSARAVRCTPERDGAYRVGLLLATPNSAA